MVIDFDPNQGEHLHDILNNLEEIEDEIERCIEAEDFDTMADWIDARSTWYEELHLLMKEVLP
jgi:hypothetical protein